MSRSSLVAERIGVPTTIDSSALLQISAQAVGNKNLVIQAIASQTGNFLEFQDSSGVVLAKFLSSGLLGVPFVTDPTNVGPYLQMSTTYAAFFNRGSASGTPLFVVGMTGQTGDLQAWESIAGTIFHRVTAAGYQVTRKVAAPADGDLGNSEAAYWLDATVGATKFMVKAKDSSGNVRTGSIALA